MPAGWKIFIVSAAEGAAGGAGQSRPPADFQEVEVDSLRMTQPRSVGIEDVGFEAASGLCLLGALKELRINGVCLLYTSRCV